MIEKRPRIYACEIALLKTRTERLEALENNVPRHLQKMVQIHVETIFRNRRK